MPFLALVIIGWHGAGDDAGITGTDTVGILEELEAARGEEDFAIWLDKSP